MSWDFSADYKLNDDVNFYARVASGFRAPSIQGRNLAFGSGYSTARSETIQSYEAGVKTSLFDNALRFNFDGFDYYVHNMQFSAIGGSSNSVNLLNAKGGLAYGLESDAEWAATENLLFNLGASWTHTAIRDPGLTTRGLRPVHRSTPQPLERTRAMPSSTAIRFRRRRISCSQPSAKYTYPLENGGEISAYTDWWWQGYTNFFLYKSAEYHTNGNYEGGFRISYLFPDKSHEVALYARNITDARNVQGGIDFNNLTGFVGDPRVIGGEASTCIYLCRRRQQRDCTVTSRPEALQRFAKGARGPIRLLDF